MKFAAKLFCGLAVIMIAGCKTVKIEDGRVPSSYLSEAKKLAGTYRGEFNGVRGNLIIAFNGNKPVVTYQNSRGTDILNNNCNSRIGDLRSVTIKGDRKDPEVRSAVFDFNPISCALMVRARDISLSFKQTKKGLRVTASLFQDFRERQICDGGGYPGRPGYPYPCRIEHEPVYLYGTFYR